MPVFGGKWRKSSIAASNPPADPPMPTIGQVNFAFAGSDLAFGLANFECDNFLPLVFTREEDTSDFAFRFPAIGRVYVSLGLRITQAAIGKVEHVVFNALPNRLRLCRLIFAPSATAKTSPSEKSIRLLNHSYDSVLRAASLHD
ncbi:MAG: hypothetical protein WBX14_06765 [Candidatus Udaeobacter sp.]